MPEQASAKPRTRVFFLDNLRIYLTILVIFHHAALAYGGEGNWGVKDPAVDDITYFMSAFFLLAGYFTPRSFERKGSKQFLIDRLIRLGIPIVIYTTILVNINEYILDVYYRGGPYTIKIESIITLCDNLCNFQSPS
jgi:peptidoglycan/LPS O-acetylase OafA/YrhL